MTLMPLGPGLIPVTVNGDPDISVKVPVIEFKLYAEIALDIFKKDKTALTYDLNKTAVNALVTELDTSLMATVDKLKLYAILTSISPTIAASTFEEVIKRSYA